ncbi:hypothetical protein E2C01_095732 [Portunus trituberculatus]|uniref:Uncharacterized protein n=1 Tax=Portunus trituberculatus TaxID=210409 RepID=A0A5B7JQL1_PORTR|nr:hypothetical protein [Portunus trituberculatus]
MGRRRRRGEGQRPTPGDLSNDHRCDILNVPLFFNLPCPSHPPVLAPPWLLQPSLIHPQLSPPRSLPTQPSSSYKPHLTSASFTYITLHPPHRSLTASILHALPS